MSGIQNRPYICNEERGVRYYCRCGRSANQPYCDGSHKGTGIEPMKCELDGPKRIAWCGCRKSGSLPFCDGSHHLRE